VLTGAKVQKFLTDASRKVNKFFTKMSAAANYKIIKEFRGKTAAQIEEETGISKQNLSAWENELSNPGKKFIDRLVKYFGVPRELFFKDGLTLEYLETHYSGGNNTSVQMEDAITENQPNEEIEMETPADVYRKIVEGGTEYFLVPKTAFDGAYRFVPVEHIHSQVRELDAKDSQIQNLTSIINHIVVSGRLLQSPKIEEAQKNAGV
jgi:transcriptional regulator with XRE-family HTH domain